MTIQRLKREFVLWSYEGPTMTRLVQQARDAYPDIHWRFEKRPQIHTGIEPLVETLRCPVTPVGLVHLNYRFMPQLIERHWLQPLDGAFSKDEKAAFDPLAMRICETDGHQYGVPDDLCPHTLIVRKAALDKAGMDLPASWEDLLDQVRYFTRRMKRPILGVGLGGYNRVLSFLLALLGSNGLDPRKGLQVLLKEEPRALAEAYEWARELFQAGQVLTSRPNRILPKGRLVSRGTEEEFFQGKMVYYVMAPGNLTRQPVELQRDLVLLHFPAGPAARKRFVVVHGSGWAVPHNGATLELSLNLLRAIGAPHTMRENELQGGKAFTALRSLWSDEEFLRQKPLYAQAWELLDLKDCLLAEPRSDYLQSMYAFQETIRDNLPAPAWLECIAPPAPPADPSRLHPALTSALRFIETHVEKITSIRQVAEAVRYNPNYLNTLFRQELRSSCWTYIKEQRMLRAKALLANPTLTIKEIAFRLNFSGASAFSQVFTRHFNVNPRAMRHELMRQLHG